MKLKLIVFLVVSVLLVSCKKGGGDEKEESVIKDAFIAFEKPIGVKNEEIFIAVRYWKEGKQKDDLMITLNGARGVLQKEYQGTIEGYNCLFKFNGPIQDEAEVQFLVNGKVEKSTVLLFAEDMSLSSVWSKLSKDYLKRNNCLIRFFTSGGYQLTAFNIGLIHEVYEDGKLVRTIENTKPVWIGTYGNQVIGNDFLKPFIYGLEGMYNVSFNEDKTLKEIKVIHGSASGVDPNFSSSIFYQKLSSAYGEPVSSIIDNSGSKNTIYKFKGNQIRTIERPYGEMYSIVTKL